MRYSPVCKPGPTVGAYEGPVEVGERKAGAASAEIKCVSADEAIKITGAWRVVAGNVGGGGPVLPTPIPTPGSKSRLLGKRSRGGDQTKGFRKKRKGK